MGKAAQRKRVSAFKKGETAHKQNRPLESCPYQRDHMRDAWERGWKQADRARKMNPPGELRQAFGGLLR